MAPYPFTTVTPNLGVTQIGGESESSGQRLVLADLPGLIEGAHQVCACTVQRGVCGSVATVYRCHFLTLHGIVIGTVRNCCKMSQCIVTHPATTAYSYQLSLAAPAAQTGKCKEAGLTSPGYCEQDLEGSAIQQHSK